MERPGRSTALVLAGVGLLAATLLVSAALAPAITAGGGDGRLTLVGSQGGGPGWHEYGSVYLLRGAEVVWREGSADSYFDVTRLSNGTVLAGYMDGGAKRCGPYDAPCARTGYRIIAPGPEPRVVGEYGFPVRTRKNSEVHAAERLPSGAFLVSDMERERIFTVRGGEITWSWNASGFYEAPADPTRRDWLHLNDVDRIGEGRYLVSVRNANQLLIVERGAGVVEVINRDAGGPDRSCLRSGQLVDADGDGDVRCGDPTVLNHQHNPQWLGDGAVLVADSDNDRVVELHRRNGSWEPVWSLHRAGGIAFDWPRDADRLPNGNVLITDTLNRRIVEVTPAGEVVWSVRTPRIPYEADRLPVGEAAVGPRRGPSTEPSAESGEVPVLSTLLVGLRAVAPWVPFWFAETQLGLALLGLALIVAGALDRRR